MNYHDDPDDIEYRTAVELQMRKISDDQFRKFEGYAAEIFSAFGLDLNTPATKDTPQRFIKALFDATEGYDGDPKLLRVFETECRGEPDCRISQVIEGPSPFFALMHSFFHFGARFFTISGHRNSFLYVLNQLFSLNVMFALMMSKYSIRRCYSKQVVIRRSAD